MLAKLALRDQPVALIVADQRMPQMTGIEMLEQARTHAPGAKYLLLTAYADTDVAIQAINDIGLDYYLLKPWDPPEEQLYPVIDDLLADWRQANPDHTSDVRCGRATGGPTAVMTSRCSWPATMCRTDGATSSATLRPERLRDLAHAMPADLPLVLRPRRRGHCRLASIARAPRHRLGMRTEPPRQPLLRSCCSRGWRAPAGCYGRPAVSRCLGGPAHASRGRAPRKHPGARPGMGPAHRELPRVSQGAARLRPCARRRSLRFPASAPRWSSRATPRALRPAGPCALCSWPVRERSRRARSSRRRACPTGASKQPGSTSLTGRGVYYGANASDASQTQGDNVYIAGAANSAGQAALNLSRYAKQVVLVVRAATLTGTMSRYLIDRITSAPNIEVRYRSEVVGARGEGHLERLTLADKDSGAVEEVPSCWLFVFIGAMARAPTGSARVCGPRRAAASSPTGPDLA